MSNDSTTKNRTLTRYTVTYRTSDTWATREIEAETPEHALQTARALFDQDVNALDWCNYDPSSVPLDEIEIAGPGGAGAVWQSEDLGIRLAAHDLLAALEGQTEAARAVIDAWAKGDLAAAVRELDASLPMARAAIAKARPPAT